MLFGRASAICAWKDLLRTMSSMVPVLLVAATAEARALAGATVRFSCSVVLMVESPKLSYAESRKTRDSDVFT